jgi:hypothetical protein
VAVKEEGKENRYSLVTLHVEALTARPDLLDAILYNVITEGLAQYHALQELDPFETLRVLPSPPEALDEEHIRIRRMAEDRWRQMRRIVDRGLRP